MKTHEYGKGRWREIFIVIDHVSYKIGDIKRAAPGRYTVARSPFMAHGIADDLPNKIELETFATLKEARRWIQRPIQERL